MEVSVFYSSVECAPFLSDKYDLTKLSLVRRRGGLSDMDI